MKDQLDSALTLTGALLIAAGAALKLLSSRSAGEPEDEE